MFHYLHIDVDRLNPAVSGGIGGIGGPNRHVNDLSAGIAATHLETFLFVLDGLGSPLLCPRKAIAACRPNRWKAEKSIHECEWLNQKTGREDICAMSVLLDLCKFPQL